jgi:peptide/nickel transport system substrate-binding protein
MTIFLSRNLRWWVLGVLVFCAAIALAACNPSQFRTQAAQTTQLIHRTPGDPKTFNYALIGEAPNIRDLVYRGLISENGKGEIVPALAESWQVSQDKLRIVFTLRDGLKWSDGQPLTADDVVFSYNDIYMNKDLPTGYQDLLKIGQSGKFPTVRKLNQRQVEFISPEPFAPFLRITGIGIMPAHVLRKTITERDQNGNLKFLSTWRTDTPPAKIIGNGPYVIESYVPSQRLVFRRNPYYWEKDEQGNSLPYIERIVWRIVEASDTALIQFRSGGLDIMALRPESFMLLKREEERGNFTIYNGGPGSSTLFVTFNLNKGRKNGKPVVDPIKSRWFNNVAFRQAVAYAIDRQTMLNNSLQRVGTLQNSSISVQSPYYLSPEEGLKVYDYNLDKARQLLTGAGFTYNSTGQLLDKDGNPVRFTMLSQTGSRLVEALGAQIKRDLDKIGIRVYYSQIDFGTLGDKLSNSFEWECWLGRITGGVEPNDGFNVWSPDGSFHPFNQKTGPGQPPLEGRQVADWEAKIGQLYIQAARELDEAKRKEIYAEVQQITQEFLPFIYLLNPLELVAIRNRIQGVEISALYYENVLWNAPKLKIVP